MSFLLENIQTPLSEQTAYILGGIVSACSYNEEQSAWLLPVIHNPGKVTSTDLQSHQNSLKKILSGMYAKFIKKTDLRRTAVISRSWMCRTISQATR